MARSGASIFLSIGLLFPRVCGCSSTSVYHAVCFSFPLLCVFVLLLCCKGICKGLINLKPTVTFFMKKRGAAPQV